MKRLDRLIADTGRAVLRASERISRCRFIVLMNQPKVLHVFSIAIAALLISMAIGRPFWLDEIFTIQFNKHGNVLHTLTELYKGADSQAPLYYGIMALVLGYVEPTQALILRFTSIVLLLAALPALRGLLREWRIDSVFPLAVFLFAINGYVTTFIAIELRTYSLYFTLFIWILYFRSMHWREGGWKTGCVYALLLGMFLLTHYIALYYVMALFVLDAMLPGKLTLKTRMLPFMAAFGVFGLWIPGLLAQWELAGRASWAAPWGVLRIGTWVWEMFRSVTVLVVLGSTVALLDLHRKGYARSSLAQERMVLLVTALLPLALAALSWFGLTIMFERYLIPSFAAMSLLSIIGIARLPDDTRTVLTAVVLMAGIYLGMHRAPIFREYNQREWLRINMIQAHAESRVLVCESISDFVEGKYYATGDVGSNIYYAYDADLTDRGKDKLLINFATELMLRNREMFGASSIRSWGEFAKENDTFFFIDSPTEGIFDLELKNNPTFKIISVDTALYLIKKGP